MKIFKYQKVTDIYTTHEVIHPDYEQMSEDCARIIDVCTIDGLVYISVPDTITLPEQPEIIKKTLVEVILNSELKTRIKSTSCHIKLMESRIADDAKIRYTKSDEVTLDFLKEFLPTWGVVDYISKCRVWDKPQELSKIY